MADPFDILVIGGGAAGTAAALAAADGDARVGLVRRAPGATALAAGGWRGPIPGGLARMLAGVDLPHKAVQLPLPHPVGILRTADFAPPAHATAAPEDGTLVCGVVGLPGFHAPSLARLWGDGAGVHLDAVVLDPGRRTPGAGWSPVALAGWLDRAPERLAEALARAVRRRGARRVVLPPVLGLERAPTVRRTLEEAAGVPVGEALARPPSVPGWRLDRALLRALESAGVAVVRGRAAVADTNGRRVETVVVEDARPDGAPARLAVRQLVLATGKFLGGGITGDTGLEEPALGCPVWIEHAGEVYRSNDPLALTNPERGAEQPLLAAGVHTDEDGRPVNRWGGVVYENVRAAGTVRAGWTTAGTGLGAAARDGWQAGVRAREAL